MRKTIFLKSMKQTAFSLMLVLVFQVFSAGFSFAEETNPPSAVVARPVRGKVLDDKGQPMSDVSVKIKNSTGGTVTNSSGEFSLELSDKATVLIISHLGFETKEVSVQGLSDVVINMVPATGNVLNDIVVVGYQKQSVKKSTSAIQVISGRAIENLPAPSFDQLLQGKVSGINIQNFSGEPGVRNTFTVRGNSTIATDLNSGIDQAATLSTPLYVVDGIPLSINDLEGVSNTGTNMLAGININDIESIIVQKDAAATATWGSRGANGVVVIKTKRGRPGKPVFKFSYYTGITQKPELLTTVTGAEERNQKLGLMYQYGNYPQMSNVPQVLSDSLNPAFNNATDWQDLFYRTGRVSNSDLSISAGNELVNYRLGLNYYNEDGIIRNTGFKRYSMRGNFDFKISSKLNAILNISTSILDRKRGLGRGRDQVIPIDGVNMPASFYYVSDTDKDFYYGQYDKLRDKNRTDQLSAYLQLNYDIIKGIQYSFQGSYSSVTDRRDLFQPSEITSDHRSFAESNNGNYQQSYLANILTFSKSYQENTHNLGVVLTQSLQVDKRTGTYVGGYNVPDDNIQVVSGIPQQDLYGYSVLKEAGLLSFLGQVSYDFKGKYLVNASYRADASSRFGEDSKWGHFPAISLSWIASEENFIKKADWINFLKFRASYGLTGSLPDDFYAPFNIWNVSQGSYNGISMATPSFVKPITLPNLTWNKSDQLNVGADLYMLRNRVNLTVDLYRRYNTNPILNFPFPFYTGYSTMTYNAPVKILNEGVDLQIQTRNLRQGSKLQWTTNFNMSYNKNRIAALPNGNRSFYKDSRNYNQMLGYTVGQPIYNWFQMLYTGVYNTQAEIPVNPITGNVLTYFKTNYPVRPGFPNWTDVNKDWDVWSDEDRGEALGDLVSTGDPNPRFTGGIYNEFLYQNFSLGILGTYTIGRDIINTFESSQFSGVWNFGSINNFANQRLPDLSQYNYWTPANGKTGSAPATFPSLSPFGPNYYQFLPFSTMWNDNGSYFKIRSISLGYTADKKWVNKLKLQNVRFYSILDNVFIFQKARVPDAELVSPQGEYTGGAYPLPKKFTIGIDISF
jgi:TonB-linked SusC/RagA family outer membrane protein